MRTDSDRKDPRAPAGASCLRHLEGARLRVRREVGTLVLLLFGLAGPLRAVPANEPDAFRISFSTQVFADVNESDARAALRVWFQTLGAERGIAVDPALEILDSTEAMKNALLARKVDGVTMTTAEFRELRHAVPLSPIILGRVHGETTEEYLLLVHRDNPAVRLADLQGTSVAVLRGSRASLAAVWMETLLLEEHLGAAKTFWGKTMTSGKLVQVVLPVFFRQADACVVTRNGFLTMSELNPQVGRQLRILAQSPALVPSVFCFHGDMAPGKRTRLLAQMGVIGDTASGRQILTLFQSEQLIERPVSDLDAACALLDRHERLLAEVARAAATTPAGEVPPDNKERGR